MARQLNAPNYIIRIEDILPSPNEPCILLGDIGILIFAERELVSLAREHQPRRLHIT